MNGCDALKNYIFVGIGGVFGAAARYSIKLIENPGGSLAFPLNTFLINITGCFILSLLFTLASEIWSIDEELRLGIGTGFVGAFTTFSTLCKETVLLLRGGAYYTAAFYIILSAVIGLCAVLLGSTVAKFIGRKTNISDHKEKIEKELESDVD